MVRKTLENSLDAVNPELHNEFISLCALYYSGEISEEEWALLQIHMAYCDSCHRTFLEYEQITSDVIPAMAAAAAADFHNGHGESARSLKEAERRLMSRLDSLPVQNDTPRRSKLRWQLPAALLAACGLGAASIFGVHLLRTNVQPTANEVQTPSGPGIAPGANSAASGGDTQQALEHSEEQIASLEQQVATAGAKSKQAALNLADLKQQLADEQIAHQQLSAERDRLSQQLFAVQTELDSVRNSWASNGKGVAEQPARTATLESQVRELKASLDEKDVALSDKDRMLDLDKDFLAHDRDIRDLIGARNLYIADIFDTDESGKTAKQFGRIFYTKDRSLIFYGFDLDSQASHKQNVSFQVWGNGSDRTTPVSLGLFYQDDSHKRWVLRCNDAKTLARLDMVFVTVEPPGGSTKPTGKQLLRAYLQIHPNHP